MRRAGLILSVLLVFLIGAMGLFTGILFKPFLGILERSVEENTRYTVTLNAIRLSLTGNIVGTQLVLRKGEHAFLTVPEVVLDPRWSALVRGRFIVDALTMVLEDGFLKGRGTVERHPFSINLEGTTDHFPLDRVERGLAYTGQWRFSGDLPQWDFTIDGHLNQGVSVAKSNPTVSCRAHFVGQKGQIDLVLGQQRSEVSATLKLDTEKEWMEGDFKVRASPLSSFDALWPDLSQARGSLAVAGHIVGPWAAPGGTVRLEGEKLFYKGFAVNALQAYFERNSAGAQTLSLNVVGSSLAWVNDAGKGGALSQADVSWVGTLHQGDLQWEVKWHTGASLKGRGPAQRKESTFSWSWKALRLILPQGDEFSAIPGGSVDFTPWGEIDVKNLQLGQEKQSLTVRRFSLTKGTFACDASAQDYSLKFPGLLEGRLNGMVSIKGSLVRPEGDFDLKLSSAKFRNVSDLSVWAKGRVENGFVSISQAGVGADDLPSVWLHGTLPWAWIIATDSKEAMNIALETGRLDPSALLKNVPDLTVGAGGFLQGEGRLQGSKGALTGQGTIVGFLPLLELPSYGIAARDTNIDLLLNDRHLSVRKAETKWGKGTLRVSGEGDLPSLNLDVAGTQISLAKRRRLELFTDLHLKLRGTLAAPHLMGNMAITQGTYEATKKKKTEDTPKAENVTFRRLWDSLKIEVEAAWPNNVWYRDGLTKIETRADLEVIKMPGNSPPGIRGLVTVLKGNYDAYGRDFIIKTGELTFTDPSEMDPQLNGHATHKMKDTLIELNVSGTAKKPELHFQSTPPLPEQDILALLAIGKVPGQSASQGTAKTEGAPSEAAELAADVVSNYLTRELRSAGMNVLDLDVIRVSPTDKGSQWTVGRYWGSKLFLSYSYHPEDAANQVLKAEYNLTPRWTFVGQTGSQSDNYLDLTFRLPVGKSRNSKK